MKQQGFSHPMVAHGEWMKVPDTLLTTPGERVRTLHLAASHEGYNNHVWVARLAEPEANSEPKLGAQKSGGV